MLIARPWLGFRVWLRPLFLCGMHFFRGGGRAYAAVFSQVAGFGALAHPIFWYTFDNVTPVTFSIGSWGNQDT